MALFLKILFTSSGRDKTKAYNTICPRSSDPFYTVTYYIKYVTISWTHSIYLAVEQGFSLEDRLCANDVGKSACGFDNGGGLVVRDNKATFSTSVLYIQEVVPHFK